MKNIYADFWTIPGIVSSKNSPILPPGDPRGWDSFCSTLQQGRGVDVHHSSLGAALDRGSHCKGELLMIQRK